MTIKQFGVEQWTELFREIGLNDQQMADWHMHFERRFPQAHQSFLQWLGLTADKIEQIRQKYSEPT